MCVCVCRPPIVKCIPCKWNRRRNLPEPFEKKRKRKKNTSVVAVGRRFTSPTMKNWWLCQPNNKPSIDGERVRIYAVGIHTRARAQIFITIIWLCTVYGVVNPQPKRYTASEHTTRYTGLVLLFYFQFMREYQTARTHFAYRSKATVYILFIFFEKKSKYVFWKTAQFDKLKKKKRKKKISVRQ